MNVYGKSNDNHPNPIRPDRSGNDLLAVVAGKERSRMSDKEKEELHNEIESLQALLVEYERPKLKCVHYEGTPQCQDCTCGFKQTLNRSKKQ